MRAALLTDDRTGRPARGKPRQSDRPPERIVRPGRWPLRWQERGGRNRGGPGRVGPPVAVLRPTTAGGGMAAEQTPAVARALAAARRVAAAAGAGAVTPRHLLHGLLAEPEGRAAVWLAEFG